MVGGSELEVEGLRDDDDVVASEEDVWDEGVRGDVLDDVRGLEVSDGGSEEEEEVKMEESGVEEEKDVGGDEEVLSRREEVDVVEVLTLSLVEEAADVLLAWLLDPPPAVPDGEGPRATYPYRPWSWFPHLSSGYPGQLWLQSDVSP